MTQQNIENNIIGQTITGIYETENTVVDNGGIGPASYFDIVIEVKSGKKYNLGLHDISPWISNKPLSIMTYSFFGDQAPLEVLDKKIIKVLRKNPDEFVDGSFSLLLENNVFIAHECGNGDQLYIGDYNKDYYDLMGTNLTCP